jgi:hypothetical protein
MLNFNVLPYNDDYTDTDHFYRVLFKPSVAVQARELTQAQSILQNQLAYLGNSIYQQGSMVIPGQIATDPNTGYVCLNPTFGMIGPNPIPIDLDLFTGQIIQGSVTGIQAQVVYSTPAVNSDPPTLFVKYLSTGTAGQEAFAPSENLFIVGTVQNLAQVQTTAPTGLSITAQIGEGVYYVYGIFVRVEQQYLILNKYSNVVSCRIGLNIVESIVTWQDDPSLLDNAQGSNNYAAPGADRYKIDLILASKLLTDTTPDTSFIELVRLVNSVTQVKITTDTYSVIEKELAQRMMDTDGDFTVRNFQINILESLDAAFVTTGTAVGGTAQSGMTPASIMLATNASAVNGAYVNDQLYINSGTGAGQTFTITGYVGATKTATLDPNYLTLGVADTTSVYTITNPALENQGLYPPPPFGTGSEAEWAVGLQPGRGYVDGYLVNTIVTQYVTVNKARDSAQTTGGVIQVNMGNYILAKNLFNIPLPSSVAPEDFLTVALSNKKSNGSFTQATDQIGTARIHAIEFYQGTNQATTDAVFKVYLFDIAMNSGQSINYARSFYLTSNLDNNNNGDGENAYGDILAQFSLTNISGTGLIPGNTITGPNGIGTEIIVSFDPINFLLLTQPATGNPTQVLNNGSMTAPNSTTAVISGRTQLFDTADSLLIYHLPQSVIKTVTNASSEPNTEYFAREMFEAQRNGSGQFIFNTASGTPFVSFNPTDYLACIVASSNSPDIGEFVDLSNLISSGSFSGDPANTTLTIEILSGLGAVSGCTMKLMGTVVKAAQAPKSKTLTTATLAIANPTATMSLQKADLFRLVQILDSTNPAVNADPSDSSNVDITGQYRFDTGQRDYFYDVASIQLLQGAPGPKGRILITFTYLAHSGTGDYFCVDSYTNQVAYGSIPVYLANNGSYYSLRDCLDFRPRIGDGDLSFATTGSSYSASVKPNSTVTADFQYYLARTDKIYVDSYGNFNDIKGTSALVPQAPADPLDGMMLYTIALNAYTFSTTDCTITSTNNQGYTMKDIADLDTRISNLEYYTSLNLLEQSTQNLQVTDASTGLQTYKNGYVVDTFVNHNIGNVFDVDYKCAVDPNSGYLRPLAITNNNSMLLNVNASSGYVLMSQQALLPYTDVLLVQQHFATGEVNVNPFAVFTFNGTVLLDPPTDTWIDTTQLPVINNVNNSALANIANLGQWSAAVWGSWQTSWVGTPVTTNTPVVSTTFLSDTFYTNPKSLSPGYNPGSDGPTLVDWGSPYETDTVTANTTTTQQIGQVRTATETSTSGQISSETVNNSIVDTGTSPYIRSRRIKIVGTHFKPNTQVYPYFDGIAVSQFCRPYSDTQLTPTLAQSSWVTESILWGGDYSPQDNANVGVSESGDQGETATYTVGALNQPIFTDFSGTTTLFFEIPCNPTNEFLIGTRVVRLTSDPNNGSSASTWGDATYTASGIIEQNQETISSIETPVTKTQTVSQTQTITNTTTKPGKSTSVTYYVDPLAESFLISQTGGVYVTKIDVFFATADPNVPITMQIRAMDNGAPSQTVAPFSTKTLYPNNPILSALDANGNMPAVIPPYSNTVINVSDDASVATSFYFDCPVYLSDSTEYCFVLIANSILYNVYVATLGQTVIGSNSIVSTTPYLGSFFESQNASTWVADLTTNMKFNIWQAQFDPTQTGQIYFTSSSLIPDTLSALPFQTVNGSNLVRVYHSNHGMPVGEYHISVVTLANIPSGTYNGLTNTQLTGTFSIGNVDLDSYTITVPGSAAVGSSRVGPDGVTATKNQQFDSICLLTNEFTPTGTGTDWGVKFTTGKSVNTNSQAASQEPYLKDSTFTAIEPNITFNLPTPRMIASDINETTSITGASAFDRKSLVVSATMGTNVANLTPMIDTSRVSDIIIGNRLDDPTFASYTLDPMDQAEIVESTDVDYLNFASQTILVLVGVTGGQYQINETVTGSVSNATGVVVAWDSINLTLTEVSGNFQNTEALTGQTSGAIGTIYSQSVVNTITNPTSVLDFSVFIPGYSMTIVGAPSNQYLYPTAVVILNVNANVITVAAPTPFTAATNQANVFLTQYGRYVAESGPDGCTTAARYITHQLALASASNSLQVYFDINLPPGAFIDVYYQTITTNQTSDINTWVPMSIDNGVNTTTTTNPTQFNEYTYTVDKITPFTLFAIKLVMRGGNTSQVPLVQNFRAIALTN